MIIIASTLRSDPSVRVADAARLRLDAGCGALALAAPFYRHEWEALRPMLPRESVLAVELFVPFGRGARPERLPPGRTSPFCLGALNREEKRDAEKHGSATISFASHQGARYVLLPTFELEARGPRPGEPAARANRPEGGGGDARRAPETQARLDSYLSTLDRLLGAADRYQVTLAITPMASAGSMPDAEHAELCLAEFRGAPLRVWPDTAEEARAARLDREAVRPWHRYRPVHGVTLRDVDRDDRVCLPGEGSLEWPALIRELEEAPRWLVDPPAGAGAGEISGALELLRGLLEPEAEDPLFPGR
jgi:sugar phosphate isomerase/epimerase